MELVYGLAGEGRSCPEIAAHLNGLGVSTGRNGAGRKWCDASIQYVLKNPVYRGVHRTGKYSRGTRRGTSESVERAVPAIVDEAPWRLAQATMKQNRLWGRRSEGRHYLLRGLIRCGHCGSTYVGTAENGRIVYRCNGRLQRKRSCRAKQLSGELEQIVWAQIEEFLRSPAPVLKELAGELLAVENAAAPLEKRLAAIKAAFDSKVEERDRVLRLFRRGAIDEPTLDRQLREVEDERAELREEVERLERAGSHARETEARLRSVGDLLRELARRLNEPLNWETRRKLVETLIAEIQVETVGEGRARDNRVTVSYCFPVPDSTVVGARKGELPHAADGTVPGLMSETR